MRQLLPNGAGAIPILAPLAALAQANEGGSA